MTDRRLIPDPDLVRQREPGRITVPLVDLCRTPAGARDRQLLLGEAVTILADAGGWSYVQAAKDGYCGHVPGEALGPSAEPTHKVTAAASHAYAEPSIKSPDRMSLSFGSLLTALSETPTFIETEQGFIPRQHVHRAGSFAEDPAAIAALFTGTPYLWGGNSRQGIDCSGLVQAACLACNIACPGDSDLQLAALGTALPAGTPYRRNDLIFWPGHVAIVTDARTILHANAGHMAVAFEPIADAIARIEAQGDGPPSAYKRLPVSPG